MTTRIGGYRIGFSGTERSGSQYVDLTVIWQRSGAALALKLHFSASRGRQRRALFWRAAPAADDGCESLTA